MDRRQEYEALLRALEETPPALEYTVQRAVACRRRRRWGRRLGIPAASLAGVFTAFVVLVNTSMPFAMACSGVPGLRELMAAVALSPSLKAAVEHDYAQYIGQSQTDNGITLRLEYLILDQGQISFFMEAEGPYESYLVKAKCLDGAGKELQGGLGISSVSFAGDTLANAVSLVADDSFQFPEEMRMECRVEGQRQTDGIAPEAAPGTGSADGEEPEATFVFTFPMDTQSLNDCRSLPVGDWVEVDGQRLRFGLDSYPTHGRLTVEEHPDNTARLAGMDFYLEDETGRRYEDNPAGSVGAIGNRRMCDTTYFSDPAHLTLYITRLEWLDQGRERVTVDLETGAVEGVLPEGVSVYARRVGAKGGEVAFLAPNPPESSETNIVLYQVAQEVRWKDVSGAEQTAWSHSSRSGGEIWPGTPCPEGYFAEIWNLEDCPDTVEIDLHFSRRNMLEQPIAVTLQ